jgi:hypothetical protein
VGMILEYLEEAGLGKIHTKKVVECGVHPKALLLGRFAA